MLKQTIASKNSLFGNKRDAYSDTVGGTYSGLNTPTITYNPTRTFLPGELLFIFKNQIELDIISVVATTVWSSILPVGKQQLKVDLPELGQGVYLIQVTESNKKHYKKMVINK
jgi:hypothetical protein